MRMEKTVILEAMNRLFDLREELYAAYDQGDAERIARASQQIDAYQQEHWKRELARDRAHAC